MNFTTALLMAQARPAMVGLLALLFFAACSGSSNPGAVSPEQSDPRATIERFMSAVKSDDLSGMSRLWGTKDGPAVRGMDPTVAERRLRLMQIYLEHDEYDIRVADGEFLSSNAGTVRYQVRITRNNCTPVVPFTLVQSRTGWLIENVDLAQAGNPARNCRGPEPDKPAARSIR